METKVQFANDRGENLVGNLHTPDRPIRYGVVLGHCFTCSRHTGILRQICQGLTMAGCAALRFDFSGNGQSEGVFEQSTYSKQISEMKSATVFLREQGVDRIGLAGHSMGAVVALLASVEISAVGAVCCLAGRLSGMDPLRFLSAGQQNQLQQKGRVRFASRGRDLQLTSGFFADAQQFDLPQTIKSLKIPLLIVHGDQDEIIPVDEAHRAFRLNPRQVKLEIIPAADHMFSNADQRRDHCKHGRSLVRPTSGPSHLKSYKRSGIMNLSETLNLNYFDEQYALWKADPAGVPPDWQSFFQGFEMALSADLPQAKPGDHPEALKQHKVEALVYRYRDLGHLLACMDPLMECPIDHPLLNLDVFGLQPDDLQRTFSAPWFSKNGQAPLKEIINALKETYCRSIGVEYMHLQDPTERKWLQDRMEPVRNQPPMATADKKQILWKLFQAAEFEEFLNKKYVAVTRFSLEGGDVIIPMLDTLLRHVAKKGCREIILGLAHRGRLNVQTSILEKPYEDIFSEFESCYDPQQLVGAGDVKYHNGYLADLKVADQQTLRVFLMNNPSHLEAVNPVVEGFARARQEMQAAEPQHTVLPLLFHGDAAFAGQGIVAETLNMSQLDGYKTGGTIHIVINNQIGYTTLPKDARSTRYSTDVAKMLMVPIFHVHGENPETAVHAIKLAADYRQTFGKDVVLDVICYRRYGHNEGDEPYFTQPTMYDRIRKRPSLSELYATQLTAEGLVDQEAVNSLRAAAIKPIEDAYQEIHGSTCTFPEDRLFRKLGDVSWPLHAR